MKLEEAGRCHCLHHKLICMQGLRQNRSLNHADDYTKFLEVQDFGYPWADLNP